ncbi:MAG: helix-turn-helix transcriptional regulator [Gammaproteobacteria bacterium]|nr:helix-turn-helix transcriptional regulator [Gammaproteobacteria bacterium]
MSQATALIETLKQALKQHGLTYAEVARRLGMSEANVKRMFAAKRFTLDRLEEICRLMQLDLADLLQLYEDSRQRITQLTEEQEQELVSDEKLLLVAVSVRNRLGFDDIIRNYHLTEPECIRCLARLDRLKIIDLLPNNRIKLRIDEDFRWLRNGPIDRFFEKQIKNQFLKSGFSGEREQRLFLFGLLGDASIQVLMNKLQLLSKEFAELHRQDAQLSLEKRYNIGLMLAMRPWELGVFEPLRRGPTQ